MIQNPYEKAVLDSAVEWMKTREPYNPVTLDPNDSTEKIAWSKLYLAVNDYLASQKPAEIDHLNHNDTLPMVINMVNHLIDVINKQAK